MYLTKALKTYIYRPDPRKRSIEKSKSKLFGERILKTLKQINMNYTKIIIVLLLNNFTWASRKSETKLYFLPIGCNKIVHQENQQKHS